MSEIGALWSFNSIMSGSLAPPPTQIERLSGLALSSASAIRSATTARGT